MYIKPTVFCCVLSASNKLRDDVDDANVYYILECLVSCRVIVTVLTAFGWTLYWQRGALFSLRHYHTMACVSVVFVVRLCADDVTAYSCRVCSCKEERLATET